MKKIVASVGLVALGASSLPTSASAQVVTGPDTSKPWSVGLTLRGFYDDNVSTIPNSVNLGPGEHRDSFGFEVSPSASLAWALQQTTINIGFLYSLKYYENQPINSTDKTDQTFTFNGDITHSFSEQLRVRASDGFVIGQEPDMLRAGNAFSTFQRISGDNIRNFGALSLDAQLTPLFGLNLGYDNALYDYSSRVQGIAPTDIFIGGFNIPAVSPSVAGVLNRMENRAHIEGTWALQPQTKALIGYAFTDVDFTGDEYIAGYLDPFNLPPPNGPITADNILGNTGTKSNTRNYREHAVYLGVEHTFQPDLTGSLRVGASYTDYYNDPTQGASYTPYAAASLKYTYAPDSYATIGFSYDRNATDVVGLFGTGVDANGFNNPVEVTVDSQAAVVFATVNHRITPQFFASFTGQFQNNIYNGGAFNNMAEQYYLAGIDFEYRFNQYFSGHVGYDYDRLQSEIGRTFDRNRVYIGVTASY